VGVGRPRLRSVDSEAIGCVIEPRNQANCEGRRCPMTGRPKESPADRPRRPPLTGVRKSGACCQGFPRNLGDLSVSPSRRGWVHRTKGPGRGAAFRLRHPAERNRAVGDGYRAARETGVARDGRGEVGAPHSTCEAGEPTRGTPWREGGAGTRNRWRERCPRGRARISSQRNYSG